MFFWIIAATLAAFVLLKARRFAVYDSMQRALPEHVGAHSLLRPDSVDFSRSFFTMRGVLAPALWRAVSEEASTLVQTERSYLPIHKKGGTVAYETLFAKAPTIVSLYRSPTMQDIVTRVVGVPVCATPDHDQSSCSILFYERPGDHIDWHYDHNFYRGRHFTVLIALENRGGSPDGLSAANLLVDIAGEEQAIPTPPNTLVIFEGAKLMHKVTPIKDGERRLMLSMTYCTDPSSSVLQGIARRVKDTAFFGLRALWT